MTNFLVLLAAVAASAEPDAGWRQTPHSLALLRGGQVVWQFDYKKDKGKPYFHPVTIAGSDPVTDLRPADHFWHKAIWFSWKTINGLLYWEEDPKTGKSPGVTEVVEAQATPRDDQSARIELTLSYHPPGQPTVLAEKRIVEVSAPTAAGAYQIDWLSTFTAGDADVVLDRTPIAGEPNGVSWGGYAGLSLRLAPALRSWQFSDSEGPVKDVTKQARWIAFSGPVKDSPAAAIVVLEHPTSFRHPTPWYLIPGMPYFSPAILYRGPYTLPAKQSLTLKYRILLQPAGADRDAIERQWQSFAATGEKK
ncbi:MAG: hypothetical protein GX575_13520 [Candidatus Anammoximicrobium sp.]|nr:hypothetical protein [Candidatus Anammoximicrobium sp.]